MTTTESQLALYVECVFEPGDIVEIRILPSRQSIWRNAAELASLAGTLLTQNQQGENIYVGVNPRRFEGGRKAEDVKLARCLPADFDNMTLDEVLALLQRSGLPRPTLTVATGHGFHLYWLLTEPLLDMAKWTAIQKRLIAKLGSDPSIHDSPRILRLPGFENCKEEPFVPCEIIEADPTRRYAIDEITTLLPELPEPTTAAVQQPSQRRGISSLFPIRQRARQMLAMIPGAVSGQRGHDATFHVACVLVLEFDLTPLQAFPLFKAWNAKCRPPWSDQELWHKLDDANKQPGPRGTLLGGTRGNRGPVLS